MNQFRNDKKPSEEVINFIHGYIDFQKSTSKFQGLGMVVMGASNNLFDNVAIKMAKDMGNLEYCGGSQCKNKEINHCRNLLKGWISHGWVNFPMDQIPPDQNFAPKTAAAASEPMTVGFSDFVQKIMNNSSVPLGAKKEMQDELDKLVICKKCGTYNDANDELCDAKLR